MLHRRIRSKDGSRATVMWEGVLKDPKGIEDTWYGVIWDDPSRGKNSGDYKGEKLFKVEIPNSASFVRTSAVQTGHPLSDIIEDYSLAAGFLSFDGRNVETVGKIAQNERNMDTINATFTLINSFQFIWDLLDVYPNTETLTIGNNKFYDHPEAPREYRLKSILINDTNIDEKAFQILKRGLVDLERVDITRTPIKDLSVFSDMAKLTHFTHDFMPVDDFSVFTKNLGRLPNLTFLSINNNRVSKFIFDEGDFPALQTLYFNENEFDNIADLYVLGSLPSLSEIRSKRNPFEQGMKNTAVRTHIIAMLANIKKLNGSVVSPNERRDCEITFLSQYANEVDQTGSEKFPRWEELCRIHGAPTVTRAQQITNPTVKVTLKREDTEVEENLLLSMTLENIQTYAAQLFGFDEDEIDIYMTYKEYSVKCQFPDQTLEDIGATDGCVLHILLKDEELDIDSATAKGIKIRSYAESVLGEASPNFLN